MQPRSAMHGPQDPVAGGDAVEFRRTGHRSVVDRSVANHKRGDLRRVVLGALVVRRSGLM